VKLVLYVLGVVALVAAPALYFVHQALSLTAGRIGQ
jgi:hypothetical protein